MHSILDEPRLYSLKNLDNNVNLDSPGEIQEEFSKFIESKNESYTASASIENLPSHNPVVINGNSDFVNNSDWSGLGTVENPFRFNGFHIVTNGTSGVNISNTDSFFIIENVLVEGADNPGSGAFYFENVSNGVLINNTAIQSNSGFYLWNSQYNSFSNNIADQNFNGYYVRNSQANSLVNNTATNGNYGFHLSNSQSNTLINNTATDSSYGYFLSGSDSNSLLENKAFINSVYGICLIVSNSNTLDRNIASNNGNSGFLLSGSDSNICTNNTAKMNYYGFNLPINSNNNIFSYNLATQNVDFGILFLSASGSNYIDRNEFVNNNGAGVQAYDNTSDNIFAYNYWDDWTNPDIDGNLIVDTPYNIEGHANSTDNLSLVEYFVVQYINLIDPLNSNYLNSSAVVSIKISLPIILEQVEYNWNGNGNATILWGFNSSYTIAYPLPPVDGMHTLTVYAKDSFLRWHTRQFCFYVDDVIPSILNSGYTNNSFQKSASFIELNITDNLAGISHVWYTWDDNETANTISPPYKIPLISPEGKHILIVNANDTAGNKAKFKLVFYTDDTPPDIQLQNILNASVFQSGTPIQLFISGTEENLIYHWDTSQNVTSSISYSPVLPSGDGIHQLNLYLNDSAGNEIYVSYYFITDDTAPEIILNNPEHNAKLRSGTSINLTVVDDNEITRVFFNWDNGENSTLESPYDLLLVTGDEEHLLTVYAQDEAGNWAKSTFKFTTSDNPSDIIPILSVLILIALLISSSLLYRRSVSWRGKIEHILVLTKSGLPLYSQSLQKDELKADVVLAGGALVGISSMASEITQAAHVKLIKQENYCIMLEEGEYIILAILIRNEEKSIRNRMQKIISEFETLHERELKTDMISDSEPFEPTKTMVEKYFIK